MSDYLLLIEDDPDICETFELVLEPRGYRVQIAADGQAGLDIMAREGPPFLILLDLMMPGMNGMEFRTAQLREPALAGVPVIIVSGDGTLERKAALLGLPALAKPIELDTLLRTVERYALRRPPPRS